MSISKHTTADGEWRYRVRIRHRGFKKVDETFPTLAEAREFGHELKRAHRKGQHQEERIVEAHDARTL